MSDKIEVLKTSLQEALTSLEGYSLIKTTQLIQLADDSDFLDCLKAAGVDNWDGYGLAQEMYNDEE